MSNCKFFEDGFCKNSIRIFAYCNDENNCVSFESKKTQEKTQQKMDCLSEASTIINGERQDTYGAPENSFALIALYWQAYLDQVKDRPLNSVDVGNLQILFKMARCSGQKAHRDNYVDIAGYAGIVADRLMEDE